MFYIVSNNGSNRYKYVWKNQSFKGYNKQVCRTCGRDIIKEIYDGTNYYELLLEGGKLYPDLLQYCGAGDQLFVLSEKALSIFWKERVSGILEYEPVHILTDNGRGGIEFDEKAPRYYNVKISGNIDFDYQAMFLKKKRYCNDCGQYELNRKRLHPFIVDKDKWDGSEICSLATFPAFIICTDRVVQIIKLNKLKGFLFEEIKE